MLFTKAAHQAFSSFVTSVLFLTKFGTALFKNP
jgi:hypothetical protein